MTKKITESPSYLAVSKIFKGSERATLNLSGVLVVLLKTAWMDRELKNLEMAYLMREVGHWCKLDKPQRKELIDIHSTLVRRNVNFSKLIPLHIEYLENSLNSDEKKRLIETMAIISRSDLSVDKSEQLWIEKVAAAIKVPSIDVAEIMMNAKFIASDRLIASRNELPLTNEKAEDAYIVPEIVLNLD